MRSRRESSRLNRTPRIKSNTGREKGCRMPVQVRRAGSDGPRPLRALVYGASRRWKTSFCAGAPKPVFLSVASEGGDRTLQVCFPGVDIIQITSTEDMDAAVNLLCAEGPRRGWRTVIV